MPEDHDDDASSGTSPRTMKPTVIGTGTPSPAPAPQGARPTIIGGGAPAPRPTVLPGTPAAAATQRPTGLPAALPSPSTPAPLSSVAEPTTMHGTERQGIEVTLKELEGRFPGTSPETLASIQQRLKQEVLDLLTEARCAMWGVETQTVYGELASRSLSLIASGAVKDAEQHLARLLAILSEFVEAFDKGPSGLFSKRSDTPKEVMEAHEAELAQLQTLLLNALPAVNAVDAKAAEMEGEFQRLESSLMRDACAAQYAAELLHKSGETRRANALTARSGSLLEALASVRQGAFAREQASEAIRELVFRIQNGVLNALPSWLQQAAIAFTKDTRTKTENYTLRQALDDVLGHVTKK